MQNHLLSALQPSFMHQASQCQHHRELANYWQGRTAVHKPCWWIFAEEIPNMYGPYVSLTRGSKSEKIREERMKIFILFSWTGSSIFPTRRPMEIFPSEQLSLLKEAEVQSPCSWIRWLMWCLGKETLHVGLEAGLPPPLCRWRIIYKILRCNGKPIRGCRTPTQKYVQYVCSEVIGIFPAGSYEELSPFGDTNADSAR